MTPEDPRTARDYDDRSTRAARAVLIEIAQILGSFRGKFAVIGGMVPSLLLQEAPMRHVGTIDVDLTLDAAALGEGQYASLVSALLSRHYEQRHTHRRFQLVRKVPGDRGTPDIDVIVDFLMPRHAVVQKNVPALLTDFAVQRADGADLAILFNEQISLSGAMPGGGTNRVDVVVASIPALLAMKGFALSGRMKEKDAYDVYYSVRNFPGGPKVLAEACRSVLAHPSGRAGYTCLAEKFESQESIGPTWVRKFVEQSDILDERTADQWQVDAFGQVDRWLRALGVRS